MWQNIIQIFNLMCFMGFLVPENIHLDTKNIFLAALVQNLGDIIEIR